MGARCGLLHTVRYSPDATSLAHPKINQHTLDGGADACNAMESIMAVGVRHPQTCIQTLTIANANGNLTSIIIVALRNMICWHGCSSHTHTHTLFTQMRVQIHPSPSLHYSKFLRQASMKVSQYTNVREVTTMWKFIGHVQTIAIVCNKVTGTSVRIGVYFVLNRLLHTTPHQIYGIIQFVIAENVDHLCVDVDSFRGIRNNHRYDYHCTTIALLWLVRKIYV